MAKQAMRANASQGSVPGNTFEIEKDQWVAFLADFTRENRGAPARLDVVGAEVGHQVETEDLPFDAVSTDGKDGEQAVWISFGSTVADHLTHGIQNVTAIWVRLPSSEAGAALKVIANDGTTTILQLSRPEVFALPCATLELATSSA